MKPFKDFIAWALVAGMILQGCAGFEPTPMPLAEPRDFPHGISKNGVEVRVATFTPEEVETYFASNLTRKNVWPMRVSIRNESQRTYLFAKGFAGPHLISSHEAARKGRRKAGWRLTWGLVFWVTFFGIPIAIPLFVTGCQALGANSYMESEYKNWEIADRELAPQGSVSGFLFFQSPNAPAENRFRLMDLETEEFLELTVDLSKPFGEEELSGSQEKLIQAIEQAAPTVPEVQPRNPDSPVTPISSGSATAVSPLSEKKAA